MGISRDKWHKRRATGGKRAPIRMKRKFELGRQPAMTKLGERRVHQVRARGGYIKFRALKLDHGNYAWPGEAVTRKSRIISVVYNPTNPEYVRTNTVVKGSIVQIDATPFKNWYQKHYGVVIGKPIKFHKVCFYSLACYLFVLFVCFLHCLLRFLTSSVAHSLGEEVH
jgi:small subunit ribosomal protein S8e